MEQGYPSLSPYHLAQFLAVLGREEDCIFLETVRTSEEDHLSILFISCIDRLVCNNAADIDLFFYRIEEYLSRGYYLAGWLAYELGYLLEPSLARNYAPRGALPLAELLVFPAPHIFNHQDQTFTGRGALPAPDDTPPPAPAGFRLKNLRLNQEQHDYQQHIKRIKGYIEAGDTYQVNYTIKYHFDFDGSCEALYQGLRRNQSVSFGAFIKTGGRRILSFSPELFIRKKENMCTVRPMKGTAARGRTIVEDEQIRHGLRQDVKNRSENIMIVDLLRNDLGRLCRMGGVSVRSLFEIETYETLHQMTSTIHGELSSPPSLMDLFRAIFPCGSVTGAPKIRTMEIIRELELEPRGVYTGAIGYISPNGDATFSVPIRTITIDGHRGEMGIGSGIVYDSDPDQEWEECKLKGRFLAHPLQEFQLIETILWQPGQGYWLFDLHLERLADSALYFGFFCDLRRIAGELSFLAEKFDRTTPWRVRLLLAKDGTPTISAASCPAPLGGDKKESPLKIMLAKKQTSSASPFLFHKTTLRELYEEERKQALAKGYFDVIFQNEKGEVTEGAIANIFIKKGDIFTTPPIECGLLNGVFRRYFIAAHPDQVRIAPLFLDDIMTAEAVYLANSVRGLVKVELVLNSDL